MSFEESESEETEGVQAISMADLMWNLPLLDELYLSMQGQNIMLVDFYLRDLERHLRLELIDRERTPVQDAMFVSALSQMWIFAVYELLRTWRQLVRALQRESEAPHASVPADDKNPLNISALHWREKVEEFRISEEFRNEIENAQALVDPVFRRIESLRMNLAKHEVPKRKGERAMAPGYGRIDYADGSIYWMVDLGNKEIDIVSRRGISRDLRAAVIGRALQSDIELAEEDHFDGDDSA